MKKWLLVLMGILSLSACTKQVEKINYGKDNCSFCSMTIMDAKFGAELITKKGKIYKFDSGECMIKFFQHNSDLEAEQYFIVNYSTPGNLLSAAAAFYVQGGEVESPMGGNLAAFNTEEAAKKFATENHAKLLHWNEVKQLEF